MSPTWTFACLLLSSLCGAVHQQAKCFYSVYDYRLTYEITNVLFDGTQFNSFDIIVCRLRNNCGEYDENNWKPWDDECYLEKEKHLITCDFSLLSYKEFYIKILGVNGLGKNATVVVIDTVAHSKPNPCNCYNVSQLLPRKVSPSLFEDGKAIFSVKNYLDFVDPSFLTYSIKLYDGANFVRYVEAVKKRFDLEIILLGLEDCHLYDLKFSFNRNRCNFERKPLSSQNKFIYDVINGPFSFNQSSCSSYTKSVKPRISEELVIMIVVCFTVVIFFFVYFCFRYYKIRRRMNYSQTSMVDVRQNGTFENTTNPNQPEHFYEEIETFNLIALRNTGAV